MSYVGLGQVSTNIVLTATQLRNLQTLLRGRGEIGSSPTLAATRQAAVNYGTAMGVPASQIAISGSSISMPPSLLTAIQQPLPEMTFTEAEVYGSPSTSAGAKSGGAATSSKSGGGLLPGGSFVPVVSGETPSWVIPVAIGGVAIAGVVAFAVYQGRARPVTANRRRKVRRSSGTVHVVTWNDASRGDWSGTSRWKGHTSRAAADQHARTLRQKHSNVKVESMPASKTPKAWGFNH